MGSRASLVAAPVQSTTPRGESRRRGERRPWGQGEGFESTGYRRAERYRDPACLPTGITCETWQKLCREMGFNPPPLRRKWEL